MIVTLNGRPVFNYPKRHKAGWNLPTEDEYVQPQMKCLELDTRVKKRVGIEAYRITVLDPGHSVRVESRRGETLRIDWRDFAYHWMLYPQARHA